MKDNRSNSEVFSDLVTLIIIIAIVPMVYTGLFYCFDDALANLLGYPAIGNIPFWNVYAFAVLCYAIKGKPDIK